MKQLEMINAKHLIPTDEYKELKKRDDLFEWYCPDSDTTYILKLEKERVGNASITE